VVDHACVPKRLPARSVSAKAGTPACRHGLCPWGSIAWSETNLLNAWPLGKERLLFGEENDKGKKDDALHSSLLIIITKEI
jgi:hypothetical protein